MKTAKMTISRDFVTMYASMIAVVLLLTCFAVKAWGYEGYTTDVITHTSIDEVNGLQWQADHVERDVNFYEAEAYCEGLNWFGVEGWRVPSKPEMMTLYRDDISPTMAPVIEYIWTGYWTVTTTSTGSILYKRFQFTDDYRSIVPYSRDSYTNVVCVRDYAVQAAPEPIIIEVPSDGNEWKVTADASATTTVYVNGEVAAVFNTGTVNLGSLYTGDQIEVKVDNTVAEDVVPYEYDGLPAWELWFLNGTVQVDVYDPAPVCEYDAFDIEDAFQAGAASVEPIVEYVEVPVEKVVYVEVPVEKIVYVTVPAEEEEHHDNGHHYGNDKEDNHVDKKGHSECDKKNNKNHK